MLERKTALCGLKTQANPYLQANEEKLGDLARSHPGNIPSPGRGPPKTMKTPWQMAVTVLANMDLVETTNYSSSV